MHLESENLQGLSILYLYAASLSGHLGAMMVSGRHWWALVCTCVHLWALVGACGHLWALVGIVARVRSTDAADAPLAAAA